MKAQDISDKYKTNVSMNKVVGKDNPVYQLESAGKNPGVAIPVSTSHKRSTTPNKR
jgi:hypothetical protein